MVGGSDSPKRQGHIDKGGYTYNHRFFLAHLVGMFHIDIGFDFVLQLHLGSSKVGKKAETFARLNLAYIHCP